MSERIKFDADQRARLETVYQAQKFVEGSLARHLAEELGVSLKQIRTWFQNKRANDRRREFKTSGKSYQLVKNQSLEVLAPTRPSTLPLSDITSMANSYRSTVENSVDSDDTCRSSFQDHSPVSVPYLEVERAPVQFPEWSAEPSSQNFLQVPQHAMFISLDGLDLQSSASCSSDDSRQTSPLSISPSRLSLSPRGARSPSRFAQTSPYRNPSPRSFHQSHAGISTIKNRTPSDLQLDEASGEPQMDLVQTNAHGIDLPSFYYELKTPQLQAMTSTSFTTQVRSELPSSIQTCEPAMNSVKSESREEDNTGFKHGASYQSLSTTKSENPEASKSHLTDFNGGSILDEDYNVQKILSFLKS